MKCLKIEDNKGFYSIDGENWLMIDKISKNDLLGLLDIALTSDFEMDEYDKEKLGNQAHQVIYNNIHEKFKEILTNKSRFKDESERMYKNAIEKYSAKSS
ncbi:hypothetical protein [Desulforamulus aquiferis]|uniref:Uncharacterized protein n=1 Tax=Desulforamulus aquiferis TaxID=1397668 RepID=A0AAW7ZBG2_9FIRM|nr:hypothetical protein [Desulforamulus aquiferis]MDO7786565.1 hypothetical protein [Desulforamulus aquiferis]